MRRCVIGLWAALIGCGSPGAPEIPPRDEIGPPPEAALPEQCVPPYPMSFGDDWFLLADLDRGVGCYAYLERDECVLGIFVDCTDDSEDRRQWRGRVDVGTEGATAELFTMYETGRSGSRLPRSPVCCQGSVSASSTSSWALLPCQLNQCGHSADVEHAGLYLARHDPDLRPESAIARTISVPAETTDVAFDASAGTLWGLSPRALFTVAPDTGATASEVDLQDGRALAAGGGFAYAVEGRSLLVRSGGQTLTLPLPGDVSALAAQTAGALLVVDAPGGPELWAVDGASATVTATAAAPAGTIALHGADPTYLVTDRDEVVFAVDAALERRAYFDTAANIRQTRGGFMPAAPRGFPGGVAVIGPCHRSSSKTHCVFESRGQDEEPRRYAVAGVNRLRAAHHDVARDRWITVSEFGIVTQVDRATRRPRLQGQVRLDAQVAASAYDPSAARLFVLEDGQPRLVRIDLGTLP